MTPAPDAPFAPAHSALVLVDYQFRLMPALHGGSAAVAQGVALADIALALEVPVVGTEQNPDRLGPNDAAIRSRCRETLAKMHFDACADGLVDRLRAGRDQELRGVVVAGCEAHVCLMQTALGLKRAGFAVQVLPAACASRRASDHALGMQRLAQAGITLVSLEMVAFEWLHSCEHPRFRDVLQRIKQVPVH